VQLNLFIEQFMTSLNKFSFISFSNKSLASSVPFLDLTDLPNMDELGDLKFSIVIVLIL